MERTIFFIFLCAAVMGDIGKHIFVPMSKPWHDAQTYCREYYTDLAFVSSQRHQDKLLAAAGGADPRGWIGLYRETNSFTWKWSGGEEITFQHWRQGQPDNHDGIEFVGNVHTDGRWNDDRDTRSQPFYCISITAVEVKMTWEEALKHCRQNDTDLTILLSGTERLLVQKAMQKVNITEPVWIGLRYLEDRWMWVNGDPLVYKARLQGGDQDHQCPMWNRCGALTKEGLWENWDCQDKLNFICY